MGIKERQFELLMKQEQKHLARIKAIQDAISSKKSSEEEEKIEFEHFSFDETV